jgi:exosortase A-associated hydrolase 2
VPPSEPLLIESPRGALYAVYHPADAEDTASTAALFCHAFGEERKSSALTMSRLARAVAAAGLPALRFDYYGTGDSEGEFVEADVHTRLEDIQTAADCLREKSGCKRVALLGLRLGATLAARAAERMDEVTGLVLVEPVPDGEKYLGAELRRQLVRQMMTHGKGSASREEIMQSLQDEEFVFDLDGFGITGTTYRQVCGLGLDQVAYDGPVLVVQLHFNEKSKSELEAVCEAYREAGAGVTFEKLVLPPIWNRIDITLAPELNQCVCRWVADRDR